MSNVNTTYGDLTEYGEIELSGCDLEGNLAPGTRIYPTYTCGHCSAVIILRPNRTRERVRCVSCRKMICEKNELCRVQCTPLMAMAKDHFENVGEAGRLVEAIMGGETTVKGATKKGLI